MNLLAILFDKMKNLTVVKCERIYLQRIIRVGNKNIEFVRVRYVRYGQIQDGHAKNGNEWKNKWKLAQLTQ